MGSLDPAKLLVVLMIALIVLGPERLPRAARQLGRAWHELTRVREQVVEEVRRTLPDDIPHLSRPNFSVSSFVADLTSPSREASGGEPPEGRRPGAVPEPGVAVDDPSMN